MSGGLPFFGIGAGMLFPIGWSFSQPTETVTEEDEEVLDDEDDDDDFDDGG